jgi:hypothetical protein
MVPGHADLPSPQGEAFDVLQRTNQFYDALILEYLAMAETSTAVLAAEEQLGDLPLIVLSATQSGHDERERRVWTGVNAGIAARSANGVHREVAGADHLGLAVNEKYAAITADAILEMVAVVRGERPFPTQ